MALIEDVYHFEKRKIYVITFKVEEKHDFSKGQVLVDDKFIDINFLHTVFLKNNDIFEHRYTFVIDKPECDIEKLKGKVIELC